MSFFRTGLTSLSNFYEFLSLILRILRNYPFLKRGLHIHKFMNVVISGWLKKKGSKFGFWHKRFCAVQGDKLIVSKTENLEEPERVITISPETEIFLDDTQGPPPRFVVRPPADRQIILANNDIESVNSWILAIRALTYVTPNISMDSFDIVSVLGRGYYGKVMLCKRKDTGELNAIKTVHKNRLIKVRKVHTIFTERNVLMKAQHPFIVNLQFAFQTDTKVYLGLEYAPGGELFYHLQRRGSIPIDEVRLYVAELALALDYLHKNNIVYRDLKPENVLLDAQGFVKLTDFGLAKDLHDDDMTTTFCGTSEYLAPEIISRRPYGPEIDWWALGVLTYELLFGRSPFFNENKAKMFQSIRTARPAFPPKADRNAIAFISMLLEKDPEMRAKFDQISEHAFFSGLNFDDVLARKVTPAFKPPLPKGLKPENFDSTFTTEAPADSIATPIVTGGAFEGFSYVAGDNTESSGGGDLVASEEALPPSVLTGWGGE